MYSGLVDVMSRLTQGTRRPLKLHILDFGSSVQEDRI